MELLRRAKEAGYEIQAVFVLTCSSDINVRRVQERVRNGGHDVPEEKIRSRYIRSIKNLAKLVRIADRTRVIDNSGTEPFLICEVAGTSVRIWETEVWPKKAILSLLYEETKN